MQIIIGICIPLSHCHPGNNRANVRASASAERIINNILLLSKRGRECCHNRGALICARRRRPASTAKKNWNITVEMISPARVTLTDGRGEALYGGIPFRHEHESARTHDEPARENMRLSILPILFSFHSSRSRLYAGISSRERDCYIRACVIIPSSSTDGRWGSSICIIIFLYIVAKNLRLNTDTIKIHTPT